MNFDKSYFSFGNAFHCKTHTNSDNITITAEVEKQLRDRLSPADVKISLRLTRIKELHAKWIHELYEHMRKRPEIMTKEFEAASINNSCVNARVCVTGINNLFRSEEYVVA